MDSDVVDLSKLEKGSRVKLVDLTKDGNEELDFLIVGLGWDPKQKAINSVEHEEHKGGKGLFDRVSNALHQSQQVVNQAISEYDYDIDASCYVIGSDNKCLNIVFFRNEVDTSNGIRLSGDDRTGSNKTTKEDNEQIYIYLSKVKSNVEKLDLWANIYEAVRKHQHFGDINNAYIRLMNGKDKKELCRFNLSGDEYKGTMAILMGSLYRKDGHWRFNAVGEGTMNTGIKNIQETRYN